MTRRILTALSLAAALTLTGFTGSGVVPAAAQSCLSQDEVRSAVESGQAIALSSVLGQIRSTVGGEILSSPALCNMGGRLVYAVNVLSSNGEVMRLHVDAQTGAISY